MASTGNVNGTSDVNSILDKYGKQQTSGSTQAQGSTLGYDQFLTLLCAEMQYQDPLEPASNTDYVAQLATFSQLEATLSMQQTQQNTMANNLVGQYVIIKPTDPDTGRTSCVDGVVDYVKYQEDGKVMVSVKDGLYSIEDLDTVADKKYYEAIGMSNIFDSMLDQLPDVENVNSSYEEAIKQLRELYDGLTSYEQGFISRDSLTKLENYERKIAELTAAEEKNETENSTKVTEDVKTQAVPDTAETV